MLLSVKMANGNGSNGSNGRKYCAMLRPGNTQEKVYFVGVLAVVILSVLGLAKPDMLSRTLQSGLTLLGLLLIIYTIMIKAPAVVDADADG